MMAQAINGVPTPRLRPSGRSLGRPRSLPHHFGSGLSYGVHYYVVNSYGTWSLAQCPGVRCICAHPTGRRPRSQSNRLIRFKRTWGLRPRGIAVRRSRRSQKREEAVQGRIRHSSPLRSCRRHVRPLPFHAGRRSCAKSGKNRPPADASGGVLGWWGPPSPKSPSAQGRPLPLPGPEPPLGPRTPRPTATSRTRKRTPRYPSPLNRLL
jgi:hypothetical protein